MLVKRRVPYWVPFYTDMIGVHLFNSQPAASVLKHLFQKLHEKIWVDLFNGFPSQILETAILPPRVNMFLQRNDVVGKPMGSNTDSHQAALLRSIDFVG
jgi:hypothetical protein